MAQDYLFVGTYGGSVLIHSLTPNSNENSTNLNENSFKNCPLIKEIRFRHRAPVINIELVQVKNFYNIS